MSDPKTFCLPMTVIYLCVFCAAIGLTLPYPVFSRLFLEPETSQIAAAIAPSSRTLVFGLAVGLYPAGQMLGVIAWGRFCDRRGRVPALFSSLLFAALGMLIVAIAVDYQNLLGILIGRFIGGFGEGNIGIAQTIASDTGSVIDKSKRYAVIAILLHLAWVLGPIVGGVLADEQLWGVFSNRLPFDVAAGVYVITALLVYASLPRHNRTLSRETSASSDWGVFTQCPLLLPLLALCFFIYLALFLFFSFSVALLLKVFDLMPMMLGIVSGLFAIPVVISGFLAPGWVARYGAHNCAWASLLLFSVGMLLMARVDALWQLVLPSIFIGVSVMLVEIFTPTWVAKSSTEAHRGVAMGMFRATIVVAQISAALLGGWLASGNIRQPFYTGAVVALLVLPFTWQVACRIRQTYSSADST